MRLWRWSKVARSQVIALTRETETAGALYAVWNKLARESGQPCVSDIEFGKEKRYYLLLVRLSISKWDWVMKAVKPQWPPCFAATAGLARVLREFVSGQWWHKSSIQHCRVRLGPFLCLPHWLAALAGGTTVVAYWCCWWWQYKYWWCRWQVTDSAWNYNPDDQTVMLNSFF